MRVRSELLVRPCSRAWDRCDDARVEDALWSIAGGVGLWLLARVPLFSKDHRSVAHATRDTALWKDLPDGAARDRLAVEVAGQVEALLRDREQRRVSLVRPIARVWLVQVPAIALVAYPGLYLVSQGFRWVEAHTPSWIDLATFEDWMLLAFPALIAVATGVQLTVLEVQEVQRARRARGAAPQLVDRD